MSKASFRTRPTPTPEGLKRLRFVDNPQYLDLDLPGFNLDDPVCRQMATDFRHNTEGMLLRVKSRRTGEIARRLRVLSVLMIPKGDSTVARFRVELAA